MLPFALPLLVQQQASAPPPPPPPPTFHAGQSGGTYNVVGPSGSFTGATANPYGGVAPYRFSWSVAVSNNGTIGISGGANAQTPQLYYANLPYDPSYGPLYTVLNVTVTDANGAVDTQNVLVGVIRTS